MAASQSLDAGASAVLIDELVCQLGTPRTAEVLAVSPARLGAVRDGRGRLSDRQLDRITAATGKPWMLWVVDAGDRAGREGRDPTGLAQQGHVLREAYEASASAEVARAEARLARTVRTVPPKRRVVPRRRSKPAA